MANAMRKGKRGLIATLFALALAMGLVPMTAFAADLAAAGEASEAAEPVEVFVTVSNAGTLALAHQSVTVQDLNADGLITYEEAMQATHEKFCPGGFESSNGWVTKFWGVANGGGYLFMKNCKMNSNTVNLEPVAAGDELTAAVMEDTTGWSDYVGYFDKSTLEVTTVDFFMLDLKGVYGMAYPAETAVPVEASNVQIGTWQNGTFTPLEGMITDSAGRVVLNFNEPGTYVVSAKGTIAAEVPVGYDADNGYAPIMGMKDCPLTAPACVVNVTKAVGPVPMFRLYNPNSGEHFYTADEQERVKVITAGWNDEGIGWFAPGFGQGEPVYRLYNQYGGEHHYTLDAAERDMLIAAGWNDEGTGWYSDPKQTVPLLREYNPNQFACNHNYTADQGEHDSLIRLGWIDEGKAWYAVDKGVQPLM